MADGGVRRITADEFGPGPSTPGIRRSEAVATEQVWSGVVHTEPGAVSGWHHHGDHESVIYVASGALRMESGIDGRDVFDAQPGDFVYVPPHAIHREGNTTDAVAMLVVTRSGSGVSVVNVEGPEQ
jgi:uncharacterized RmlC-like cupin family protein